MKGTTKGTKVKPAGSATEEECGIWLDTTQLKEKKQQKKTPISKLLNPLAKSGGYNVAVSLNFTQTKLNMPITKQSTISSFFSPKLRDSEPSASHDEMYTSMHTEALCGVKRKHEATLEPSGTSDISTSQKFQVEQRNCDLDHVSVMEIKEQTFLHLMCGHASDEEEPPEKRRVFASRAEHNVLETQEYWNEEVSSKSRNPHIQTIPETETLFYRESHLIRKPSEEDCQNVLQSPHPKDFQEFQEKHVLGDHNTTIQRSILTSRPINVNHKKPKANTDQEQFLYKPKASPAKLIGKENRQPASPIHNSHPSPFKRNLVLSPAKPRLKEKYTHSDTEMSGDSLAMLFTQDSEGFCVIAHRDQHQRSPLKDHGNGSNNTDYWNNASARSLDKEEEESDLEAEMLFTQDSEGNVVIKH
nr:aurora kinase A and ninein-interacting protein [Misgurnus anguillicaudatus]